MLMDSDSIINQYYPELNDVQTRLRYYKQMKDGAKPAMLKYWRPALDKLFSEIHTRACLQFHEIDKLFVIDNFRVCSLEQVVILLAEQKEYMVLENLDVEIERRLVRLAQGSKLGDKASSLVKTIKNLFLYNTHSVQDRPSLIAPDHYVVNLKHLETIMNKYLKNESWIIKHDCFQDSHFVSKVEMMEFLSERKREHHFDAYLIIYALLERKIIFSQTNKDSTGRIQKGYTCMDPSTEDYRIHDTINKLQQNIIFLNNKILEYERKTETLNEKIKTSLRIKNHLTAKQMLKEKLETEKKILHLRNQLHIFENNLDDLKSSLHNHMPEECWKLIRNLSDKRLLEIEDLKEAIESMNVEKEANKELDALLSDGPEEEDAIKRELDRIELGMQLEREVPSKGLDEEVNLLKPAFPTTQKKENPLLGGLHSLQTLFQLPKQQKQGESVYESVISFKAEGGKQGGKTGKIEEEEAEKLKKTAFFGLH